jgi:drug/metabolite transporter (DMT)-like permease
MQRRDWSFAAVRDSSFTMQSGGHEGDIVVPVAHGQSLRRIGGWLFDQPYLLLSLTSLFWAANTILGRFIVGHVPPVTLAFIRWSGAFLILLPFAARHLRRDWPVIRDHAGSLTLIAFGGFSVYNTLAYYGLQYTTAINGLLLQSVGPLFVAIWTFALFRDRLTWRQAGGICVSLSGVLVIICHGSLDVLLAIEFNRGDVCFVIALVTYGFYAAYLRKRPAMHPLSFLAVGMGWGAALLVPAVALEIASGRTAVFDAESLASFAFVCIFPSLLGYLCLNRGIELIGANRAAPFIHLVPVFGSAMAIVLLNERFELYHAVGYALVFAGITTATRK